MTANILWIHQYQNPRAKNLRMGVTGRLVRRYRNHGSREESTEEGTSLKQHASIFCSTRKGVIYKLPSRSVHLNSPCPLQVRG